MKDNPVFERLVECIVSSKSREFIEILEKASININSKGAKGWTLLHYAAQYSVVEIGHILILRNADVNAKDNYGHNVLFRAAFASNGRGEFIKLLLNNGADKFEKNNSGISPFELANTIYNYNVRQFLL